MKSGKNLSIQAHFNHPVELSTPAVEQAIKRIRATGAQIRTQSPLMKHINDKSELWSEMWRKQVDLGCIPYYMFIARDTGSKRYFELPLEKCWNIFRNAYNKVSGLCRTVRGPSMSASPGKIQVLGVQEVEGEKVFVLRFLQGRNPAWVDIPFFAEYDPKATWFDQLKPAFGEEKFFFEKD
jgi:L-lysine 2,3-aminomutase